MNLFKLAGIELPEIAPEEKITLQICDETMPHTRESDHPNWQSAAMELLDVLKSNKRITFVSMGKRIK